MAIERLLVDALAEVDGGSVRGLLHAESVLNVWRNYVDGVVTAWPATEHGLPG